METIIIIVILLVVCCLSILIGGGILVSSKSTTDATPSPQTPSTIPQTPSTTPQTPSTTPQTPSTTPSTPSTPQIALTGQAKMPNNSNPGDAISCLNYNPKGDGAIYRYDGNNTMRWYPNPIIANSYDTNWGSGVNRKVDCTGFTLGPDVQAKPLINANPGEAISCLNYNPKGDGAIYRYDGNNTMRWYPNPAIANSYDNNWASGVNRKVDCTGFTLGPDVQSVFSFKGNNGTVSGNEYCRGGYESPNNVDKNLKCEGGISTKDNSSLDCKMKYGKSRGDLAYNCGRPLTFPEAQAVTREPK